MHVHNVINSKTSIHIKSKTMLFITFILAGITTLFVLCYFQVAGSAHDKSVLLLLCSCVLAQPTMDFF